MNKLLLFCAIVLTFRTKSAAFSVSLDSAHARVGSAITYGEYQVDSGKGVRFTEWSFTPSFKQGFIFVDDTDVTGSGSYRDSLPGLPVKESIFLRKGLVINGDTLWSLAYLEVTILDTPKAPQFSVISQTFTTDGVIYTYNFNDGNAPTTVTPYVSFDGKVYYRQDSFMVSGSGTSTYALTGYPSGFTFWLYFKVANSDSSFTTDTFKITTLQINQKPWVGVQNFSAPPDSLNVEVITKGYGLETKVTLHYGASGFLSQTVSGEDITDTLFFTATDLGMGVPVTFYLKATNSLGSTETPSYTITTGTRLEFVANNTMYATGITTGIIDDSLTIPGNTYAEYGYILSTNKQLLPPATDQSASMTSLANSGTIELALKNMSNGTQYYLNVFANDPDNGQTTDTTVSFVFHANTTGISNIPISKNTITSYGHTVRIVLENNAEVSIYSITGERVYNSQLSTGIYLINLSVAPGIYTYSTQSIQSKSFGKISIQ